MCIYGLNFQYHPVASKQNIVNLLALSDNNSCYRYTQHVQLMNAMSVATSKLITSEMQFQLPNKSNAFSMVANGPIQ